MYQNISLTDYMDLIDSENANFILSAWLGGENGEPDASIVTIHFQNSLAQPLGEKSTIDPGPLKGLNQRFMVFHSITGVVPANSRWMTVIITMTHTDNVNDAIIDNIHFEITCNI